MTTLVIPFREEKQKFNKILTNMSSYVGAKLLGNFPFIIHKFCNRLPADKSFERLVRYGSEEPSKNVIKTRKRERFLNR
jgi:hypothetical protein